MREGHRWYFVSAGPASRILGWEEIKVEATSGDDAIEATLNLLAQWDANLTYLEARLEPGGTVVSSWPFGPDDPTLPGVPAHLLPTPDP